MALIYHYCSPYTFLQIIEKKCLWLSSTKNMNDFSEEQWFLNIVDEVLKEHENELGGSWCDEVRRVYEENFRPSYVTCFSKNNDLLSQWRAYAENGLGVAIGFDPDVLDLDIKKTVEVNGVSTESVVDKFELHDVNYLQNKEIKENVIQAARQWRNTEGEYHFDEESGETLNDITAGFFGMNCERLAVMHKNPTFEEEDERRLIYRNYYSMCVEPEYSLIHVGREKTLPLETFARLKHRISDGFLTSYFEYTFRPEAIRKIMLGPRNKFTMFDLENLLFLNNMRHAEIESSAATYR
ncbi:DUF2971 domain-containing protein [Serratia proteamaculans]|uniref:DUF2971 domain-containing protein n=1 Tax=Serratia proteamaculans TaxID=28151 RepID=UPI0039BE6DE0